MKLPPACGEISLIDGQDIYYRDLGIGQGRDINKEPQGGKNTVRIQLCTDVDVR